MYRFVLQKLILLKDSQNVVVAHAFNANTWDSEAGGVSESDDSIVYTVGSRAAITKQRNLSQKNKI